MSYRELIRRKLFEEMYGKPDNMVFSNNELRLELDEIKRRQSWWLDLSSNVAGNAIFDGFKWLISKIR